jgi:hypothetical protein
MAVSTSYGEKGSLAVFRAKRHIFFSPDSCGAGGEGRGKRLRLDMTPGHKYKNVWLVNLIYLVVTKKSRIMNDSVLWL